MKPIFYTKIPIVYQVILSILFILATIATLGYCWRFYDFFVCHKYWLNRRILLKYIESTELSFTKELILQNIIEYKFNEFSVWYYTRQLSLGVLTKENSDLVGLFVASSIEDKMVIKIIRQLNQLEPSN